MDLPFLYQTRVLLRLGRAGATRPALRPRRTHQIRKTKFFQLQAQRRAAAAAGHPEPELSEPVVTSTITPEEQRAFARLHELALRQQAGLPPLDSGRLNVNPESILALFAGPPQRHFTPYHAATGVDSWAKKGYQQLETVATRQSSSPPAEDAVARFCSDQMCDYYRGFNEALHSTSLSRDVAAFGILQKQVFPLLELITPPSPSAKRDPASSSSSHILEPMAQTKKSARAKKSKASRSPVNEAILSLTAATANPTASPLDIVSRLYPAATLLALRLLTKHQPLSPIASSLLSIIRDLGPTSYVLAANTHFYNTFLFLRWNVSSSLSEICMLLGEMERGAVEFDKGTAAFLADWWRKQPQEKWWPHIEEWRRLIARRMESNGVSSSDEDSMRDHPYSILMGQRAEDGGLGQWARKVWL
ncbi:hypothetical protein DV735_g239, partial [Chaetothyriales sp. CBS 134920]